MKVLTIIVWVLTLILLVLLLVKVCTDLYEMRKIKKLRRNVEKEVENVKKTHYREVQVHIVPIIHEPTTVATAEPTTDDPTPESSEKKEE